MKVLALIPARTGSKGIPGKNFRLLGGRSLVQRAVDCALEAGIGRVCVSTDHSGLRARDLGADVLMRPPELAADDTPMVAVVQHVIEQAANLYIATNPFWTGRPVQDTLDDQIVVLLQPTQPLRKPEHVTQAIDLLRSSGADSVVSVVEVPPTSHSLWQAQISEDGSLSHLWDCVTRRQDIPRSFRRDGTCYAFWRKTVTTYGNIYGAYTKPLIIDPDDSCELDTEAQWTELERRWQARSCA